MLKKNLFFVIPFSMLAVIALTGCNSLGGGNMYTFQSPAVVTYSPYTSNTISIPFVATPNGEYAVPNLLSNIDGDCVYVQLTVDNDNQSSENYTVATIDQKVDVAQSYVDILSSYVDPIPGESTFNSDLPLFEVSYAGHPFYRGKLFIALTYSIAKGQLATFNLACDPEQTASNGAKDIYLQANLSGESTSSASSYNDIHAFDMNELLYRAGRDTTIQNTNYRYIKLNLKYYSGGGSENPNYTEAAGNPFEIYVLNK
jgi:hypothetical protein